MSEEKEEIISDDKITENTKRLLDELVLKGLDLGLSYMGTEEFPDNIFHNISRSQERELFTKNTYFGNFKGDEKEIFSLSYEVINERLKLTCEFPEKQGVEGCDHDWVKVTVHEFEEDELNYKCSRCYDFKTEDK